MSSTEVQSPQRTYSPESLVRTSLLNVPPYIPAAMPSEPPSRVIKLDMNESPYGPSPKARAALADFSATNRYPDFQQWELRQAIGRYASKDPEQIICGAGLDDVLNTFMHAVIEPGDEVIVHEPTFGVYRALVALYDGIIVNVPLTAEFQLDERALLDAITDRTKFAIICTPNNPTGNLLDRAAVERIVAAAPCMVVIDEAYAEFGRGSHISLMDRYPNVAIFRTMSKFAGLAGMRVGYGIFPPALMPYLDPVTPAFHNVAMASRVAAIASLDDLDYLDGIVDMISTSRDQLSAALAQLPDVTPLPSATNFLLVRLPVADASPIVRRLAERGVFVRHFANPALGIRDCLRVSVGTPEENQIFLDELASALKSDQDQS